MAKKSAHGRCLVAYEVETETGHAFRLEAYEDGYVLRQARFGGRLDRPTIMAKPKADAPKAERAVNAKRWLDKRIQGYASLGNKVRRD